VLDSHQGRGLGGSSVIKFSNWLVGDKDNYNKWAEIVGDPDRNWGGDRGVRQRLRKIERQHVNLTEQQPKYLDQNLLESHSKDGMVDLTFAQERPKR
jgi:hypothetical protein